MAQTILDQIKDLIEQQQGIDRKEISISTRIENDLDITGDDAIEFLIEFGKRFNVDVSKFMAADYFAGEGLDSIGIISRFLTGRKKKERKALTVAHLIKAIKAGRLDETVIDSF